jgi:ABC-type uncharacterized transport system auxiliary subunit
MKARNKGRWLLAAAFAAVSCSLPRTHYYTMEIPHASPGASLGIARHITIQRFQADQVLRDDRILYRENLNEVNFYEYHRWTGPPAELVTYYFTHRLKDSGTYSGISAYKDGSRSDFILQGRLHRFEEVDRGKEVFASVALELELLATKTRVSIWRGEAECSRPLASRDMAGVIRGIYACLDETATTLLNSMQKQVEKDAH